MSDSMYVDSAAAETEASQISGAATYFTAESLSSRDHESTITANGNSKKTFSESQSIISTLGNALDKDVANIRNLGNAFAEFDTMMGMHR